MIDLISCIDLCKYVLILNLIPATRFKQRPKTPDWRIPQVNMFTGNRWECEGSGTVHKTVFSFCQLYSNRSLLTVAWCITDLSAVRGITWRLFLPRRFWARLSVWREATDLRAATSCRKLSSLSLHFSRRRQSTNRRSEGGTTFIDVWMLCRLLSCTTWPALHWAMLRCEGGSARTMGQNYIAPRRRQ